MKDTKDVWNGFESGVRGSMAAKMAAVIVSRQSGRKLSHWQFRYEDGIGMVKVKKPGWRGWIFPIGPVWYVSHFSPKDPKEKDHDFQVDKAQDAKRQHIENTKPKHAPHPNR